VVGGRLVVAEPPEAAPDRWDADGLAQLGLTLGPRRDVPSAMQLLVQVRLCPDRFPRRTGVPAKRPLF
jgi:16S rRNA (guanine527-N7)-methyltransferase